MIHGLWGSGQMSFCKTLVVVDGQTLCAAAGISFDASSMRWS